MPTDEDWIRRALELARDSEVHGDVPIGCVVVRAGDEVASAGNERELRRDPTAHAEILALRRAADATASWRLEGCTVYVTLEPCAMCAGAMVLARVDLVVFGAADPKAGFAGSLGNIVREPRLNHMPELVGGVLEDECRQVLRAFFQGRRLSG
jgi:tRNA(adenine34) deaminase